MSRSPLLLWPLAFAPALGTLLHSAEARADNPAVQHVYTADPAPMVHEGAVYLCASHDEDVTVDNFFTMNDWFVFSSRDMVNWTDHGTPLSWETFSWAQGNRSWAPHCVERDGRFYFYVPVNDKIGVAVADSPLGPFQDAIGEPLLQNYQYIDPTVFVDDDGQAYLYFGNPKLWYVRLNDDMISFSGGVQEVPMTTASFGDRRGGATDDRPTSYEEGPWFYKRNDLYYLIYPTGELPEHIAYSTSTGPTGPWSYGGEIMSSVSGHAFTNHPGIIDFKGHSYFFYHTQELPGGGGYKRSVAIEEFSYGADGSIPRIEKTTAGVIDSVEPLDPYARVEGETIAWGQGIEVEDNGDGGRNVADIDDGDHIKVEAIEFRTGPISYEASVASEGNGGEIELRVDAVDGTVIGSCAVQPTGGWQSWTTVSCEASEVTGIHDLFLVFRGQGGPLFNLDWWQFTPKDPIPNGTGGEAGTGGTLGAGGALGAGGSFGAGGAGGAGGSLGAGGVAAGGAAMGGTPSVSTGGVASESSGGTSAEPAGGTSAGGQGDDGEQAPPSEPGCACSSGSSGGQGSWGWWSLFGLALGMQLRSRLRDGKTRHRRA